MQGNKILKVIINADTDKEASIEIDQRLLDYVKFTSRDARQNSDEPMKLLVVTSLRPLSTVKEFLELQNYTPEKVIKAKPINTSNYKDLVTHEKYYTFFKKFTDLNNSQQATQLLQLAKYTQFDILYDAVGAAIAVNYYVGTTQAQIKKFAEDNRLDKLTPSQISQIMEEHAQIFQKIDERSRDGHLNASRVD